MALTAKYSNLVKTKNAGRPAKGKKSAGKPGIAAERASQRLDSNINKAHGQAIAPLRKSLVHAMDCDGLLADVKTKVGHGKWLQRLSVNCLEISKLTAPNCIAHQEHQDRTRSSNALLDGPCQAGTPYMWAPSGSFIRL